MLFQEYSDKWKSEVLILHKPATQATMRSHLKLFEYHIGSKPIGLLDRSTIQGVLNEMSQDRQPKTVKNLWSTLRLVLTQAVDDGLLKNLPKPKLPKVWHTPQAWLTVGQMKSIIDAAPDVIHTAFYWLLAETGIRIGEALGLRIEDIDMRNRSIRIAQSVWSGVAQQTKTENANRILSISSHLCGLLSQVIAIHGLVRQRGFLFSDEPRGNKSWCSNTALFRMQSIMQSLGIEPTGFHAWRRGNTTLMVNKLNIPLKIAAYRLGHDASILSEDKRTALMLDTYAQAYEGIDRPFAEQIAEKIKEG